MKKHLINLLYEEIKQSYFLKRLQVEVKVDAEYLRVKNWEIVMGCIGFPNANNPKVVTNDHCQFPKYDRCKNKDIQNELQVLNELHAIYLGICICAERGVLKKEKKINKKNEIEIREALVEYIDEAFKRYKGYLEQ